MEKKISHNPTAPLSSELASYESHRAELVRQLTAEKFRDMPFSAAEIEADKIFASRFVVPAKKSLPEDFFTTNAIRYRKQIEGTDLFRLLLRMPKGALLHHHLVSEIDPDWIFERARTMRIVEEPNGVWESKQPALVYRGQDYPAPGLLEAHPELTKEEFRKRFTLQPEECDAAQTNKEMWDFAMPKYFYGKFLATSRALLGEHITNVCRRYIREGVIRVETRHSIGRAPDEDLKPISLDEEMGIFERAVAQVRKECPKFSFCIIAEFVRRMKDTSIAAGMEQVYEANSRHPGIISAIDFSGDEEVFRTFHDLSKVIIETQTRMKARYGATLPLVLHCGESSKQSLENPIDGLLLGTVRIGHGISFAKFPAVLAAVKSRQICIEVNPISNQILKHVRDLRLHPAIAYMNAGIPVAIGGDDPTLYGTEGTTYDFFVAVMAFEWGLGELKRAALNSIEHSLAEDGTKKEMREWFFAEWERFVKEVGSRSAEN